MHVLICNERFLFRFGVDRVLLILAKGLMEKGHEVTLLGNQFDDTTSREFASRVICLTSAPDYFYSNEFTSDTLSKNWQEYFPLEGSPDVVLVGGWPFFSAIPFLKDKCQRVIFLDCGAVPLEGFVGGSLDIQNKVREMRKRYLKESTQVVAISNFIAQSQSVNDTDSSVPCTSILLGADHMELSIWQSESLNSKETESFGLKVLRFLHAQRKKVILCLGRWELGCYKNSEALFDILRKVISKDVDATALVLTTLSNINIPSDLAGSIFPIGFPDDAGLLQIMREVDLGISVSLWEGFNLPLAEMQWLGRPALVFNVAAHPEVVIHPWYLCQNNDEMADKACQIFENRGLDSLTNDEALNKFHTNFKWSNIFSAYYDAISNGIAHYEHSAFASPQFSSVADARQTHSSQSPPPLSDSASVVFIDVTNATRDPANSGVIRVTRRISRELQNQINVAFVVWNDQQQRYVLPTRDEFALLSQYNGPHLLNETLVSPSHQRVTLDEYYHSLPTSQAWLLFTETVAETRANQARALAKVKGINTAAIFYDAIPILRPELCKDEAIRNNHAAYMLGLADCDVIIPISDYSADCLLKFWQENGVSGGKVIANLLPAEFGGSERELCLGTSSDSEINILCVSTLEPRKNHRSLIEACQMLGKIYPDLNWRLTLVGNRYAGADDIAQYVQEVTENNPRIHWTGIIDDQALHSFYQQATFTVYPSLIEGFGMPILESIWHGKPCLCHEDGVMAELARDGGCYTTDVTNHYSLASALHRLSTDESLRNQLTKEAVTRKLKTWQDYALEFVSCLQPISSKSTSQQFMLPLTNKPEECAPSSTPAVTRLDHWQEVLYPQCLCDNWQMNDSEKLAMTALLHRLKPLCSIEVGTYQGGSLSLISQYSETVFSIDIDPTIPAKFTKFSNVKFLTGSSLELAPVLLKNLDEAGIPVEFILIDGDHSAEGIMRDVSWLVNYVPKRPLFVLLHDSFNPNCRRGMLEAEWHKSPYLKYLDLDFIPGRVIEHGGGGHGEMWGGLALAYFDPTPASLNSFTLGQSSRIMYSKLKESYYS